MSEASTNAIADGLDASVLKTLDAQEYTLPDGRSVKRAPLKEQMAARNQIEAQQAANKRNGLYRRVGFAS